MNQSPRQPLEADYIPLARRALVASQLKAQASDEEIAAKRSCASAMHSVNVTEFPLVVEGKRYNAKLERPWGKRINVRKLYTMVRADEISLEDFLDCITATPKAVEEILGESAVTRTIEDVKLGLNLTFSEEE